MKNPLVLLAMLVTASCLNLFADEQEQKQPPPQKQVEIPADAAFYQDGPGRPTARRWPSRC